MCIPVSYDHLSEPPLDKQYKLESVLPTKISPFDVIVGVAWTASLVVKDHFKDPDPVKQYTDLSQLEMIMSPVEVMTGEEFMSCPVVNVTKLTVVVTPTL